MSDIFISYASADRERAKVVAEALAARGLSVWWDRVIPPGRQFDEVIEEALDAARCVVVLWSQASTASTWVKTEAAEAMRGKALIPAVIEEGVKIPLEFRRLQAADLSKWRGDPRDPQLLQFFESIEAELKRVGGGTPSPVTRDDSTPVEKPPPPVERPQAPQPAPPAPPPVSQLPPQPARKLSPAVIAVIAVGIVALVGAGLYYERGRSIAAAEKAAREKAAEEQAEREREQASRAAAQRKADEEQRVKSKPAQRQAQTPVGAQSPPPSGALNLKWRDSALGFSGTLAWTPASALLRAAVVDLRTGTLIGNYSVPALINQQGPTEYMVTAEFAVPGDSTTPGPHTHTSRLLVRAQQDGSLRFLQNCPRPGECY